MEERIRQAQVALLAEHFDDVVTLCSSCAEADSMVVAELGGIKAEALFRQGRFISSNMLSLLSTSAAIKKGWAKGALLIETAGIAVAIEGAGYEKKQLKQTWIPEMRLQTIQSRSDLERSGSNVCNHLLMGSIHRQCERYEEAEAEFVEVP